VRALVAHVVVSHTSSLHYIMSAFGTKRTSQLCSPMSAFGGKGDIGPTRLDSRFAEGNNDLLPALALDLVRRGVAVIAVVGSTPGAVAAKGGDARNPDHFFYWYRPGQSWSRREPRTAWRQYHRHYGPHRGIARKKP
jgi:hypothetical protein